MYETFTTTVLLEVHLCPICGCPYAMPQKSMEYRRDKHQTFYCPNGHSLHIPDKSEVERWQTKYNEAHDYIQEKNHVIESLENQNRALRGQITKLKKKR